MPATHVSKSVEVPDVAEGAPLWTIQVLRAAAVYNMLWGSAAVVAPAAIFGWAGMEPPRYPQIWQCVGMIVGVYGVGYWLASRDPFRHWPLVLVGLLGKVFGPIGFFQAALLGSLPWRWGLTIITNDLIWWIPFASILYLAFRHHANTARGVMALTYFQAIRSIRSQRNASLMEISAAAPTLVVFLRHAGCTFCRETLADLRQQREAIERRGATLAIVHMGQPMDGTLMLQEYGLWGVHQFSDPRCRLYRAFGVGRGRLGNLVAPSVWVHGVRALCQGHGLGKLAGDGFRMPAAFVLDKGRIVAEYRPRTAADRPHYVALAARGAITSLAKNNDHLAGTEPMVQPASLVR